MAPAIVTQIGTILGKPLHPAPARGEDLVSGVMPIRDAEPLRFAARGDTLLGLNLAGTGLTDEQWRAITRLNGFRAADLQALNLRNNQLTESPLTAEMRNLHWLDLSNNQLREFTPPEGAMQHLDHLWLHGNPELGTPPPEIVAQGRYAIVEYYREREIQGTEKLYEAKLVLVGDGGAGKTTLRRKIKDANAPMPGKDESTKGVEIDIDQYRFAGKAGQPFIVNIWDFAGQEKYQPIHQFFYTHRALYILVENAREQKTDFDYWLQTVELCSEKSPMLIVHNEFGDQSRGLFKINEFQGRYGEWIKADARVNFDNLRGLEALVNAIQYHIQELPHVGEELPRQWAVIRRKLQAMSGNTPYISLSDYFKLCAENGLPEPERALSLSRYLHILGAMLHYTDNDWLEQYVILQNEWATDAVYKILEDEKITFDTKGVFERNDLKRIWTRTDYAAMRPQLLELMKKFKLCYQVGDLDKFIAPLLLPGTSPQGYTWTPDKDLRLTLRYTFMPMGLLTRFIVDQHKDIAEGQTLVWKNGVVLEWNGARAEVTEQYRVNEGTIHLRVQGDKRKEFISIIDKALDAVHGAFKGLDVEKLVPCNCPDCENQPERQVSFPLSRLEQMRKDGALKIQCEKTPYHMVNVVELIESVFQRESGLGHDVDKEPAKTTQKKVFLSYSHDQLEAAKRLKTALAVQVEMKKLSFWYDQNIQPGTLWQKEIEEKIKEADIIILLLSPEFWASEFIWKKELPLVEARYSQGAKVICVMLTDNDFKETHWANLQAAPQLEGLLTPIDQWPNVPKAWQTVAEAVKQVL